MAVKLVTSCKAFFDKIFLSHPREINETFFQHFFFACRFGFKLLIAGCACIIHAIFPLLFKNTASNTVKRIHDEMMQRKK